MYSSSNPIFSLKGALVLQTKLQDTKIFFNYQAQYFLELSIFNTVLVKDAKTGTKLKCYILQCEILGNRSFISQPVCAFNILYIDYHECIYQFSEAATSGVLRNFGKFTGKQKTRLWHKCFPLNFTKCLRTLRTTASEFLQDSFLIDFIQ